MKLVLALLAATVALAEGTLTHVPTVAVKKQHEPVPPAEPEAWRKGGTHEHNYDLPVDAQGKLHDDLTRQGVIEGIKTHKYDLRTHEEVQAELDQKRIIDYQMDNTMFPTMDRSTHPESTHAPPLVYNGDLREDLIAQGDKLAMAGHKGGEWVRSFDNISDHEVAGFHFSRGPGLTLDFTKWDKQDMPAETYAVVVLFQLERIDGMRRIFAVPGVDPDAGLYVREGRLTFWPHVETANAASPPFKANEWAQVLLMRNATNGELKGYVNGVHQWTVDDSMGWAKLPKEAITFFHGSDGYDASGILGRVRLYGEELDSRHIGMLSRHAVSATYHKYLYGRRIYRDLVMSDFCMGNTLMSSVTSEHPLYVYDAVKQPPVYVDSRVEGKRAVTLRLPSAGFYLPVEKNSPVHNNIFDGEEYTVSVLFKIEPFHDKLMNIMSWENEHSRIKLRVKNGQLLMTSNNVGSDLSSAQSKLMTKRALARIEHKKAAMDTKAESVAQMNHARLQRRLKRIYDMQILEQRRRQYAAALAEENKESDQSQKMDYGEPIKSAWDVQKAKWAARKANGLSGNPKSRSYTWDTYTQLKKEWRNKQYARHLAQYHSDTLGENGKTVTAEQFRQITAKHAAEPVSSADAADVLLAVFGAPPPPPPMTTESDSEAPPVPATHDFDAADLPAPPTKDGNVEPSALINDADKAIAECYWRGGNWMPFPKSMCSLDTAEAQSDKPLSPYTVVSELASSRYTDVKPDKFVQLVVSRRKDGQFECYVDGILMFRFMDANVTDTSIEGGRIDFFKPDDRAPVNADGLVARVLTYAHHLRSTEIRELVTYAPYAPFHADDGKPMTTKATEEIMEDCVSLLPIWNAPEDHIPGMTSILVKNRCQRDIWISGTFCGDPFKCNAQAESYIDGCYTTSNYCREPKDLKEARDDWRAEDRLVDDQ